MRVWLSAARVGDFYGGLPSRRSGGLIAAAQQQTPALPPEAVKRPLKTTGWQPVATMCRCPQ